MKRFIITLFLLSILGSAFAGEVTVKYDKRYIVAGEIHKYLYGYWLQDPIPVDNKKDLAAVKELLVPFKDKWKKYSGYMITESWGIETDWWTPFTKEEMKVLNTNMKKLNEILNFDKICEDFISSSTADVNYIKSVAEEFCKLAKYDEDVSISLTDGLGSCHTPAAGVILTSNAFDKADVICHEISHDITKKYQLTSLRKEVKNEEIICEAFRMIVVDNYDTLMRVHYTESTEDFYHTDDFQKSLKFFKEWKESGKPLSEY